MRIALQYTSNAKTPAGARECRACRPFFCNLVLRDLVEKGVLVKTGAGPRAGYRLSPAMQKRRTEGF